MMGRETLFLKFLIVMLLVGVVWGIVRFWEEIKGFAVQFAPRSTYTPKLGELVLSEKELADLVKPSVVRIVQHAKGQAVIPAFDIDFKTFSVIPLPRYKPVVIPVDDYLHGSGFVVNPDGFILTNAHVISFETVKLATAAAIAVLIIVQKTSELGPEAVQLETLKDPAAFFEFVNQIAEYLMKDGRFEIQSDVVVLDPSSQEERIADMVAKGFSAEVVSVNNNFWQDNRDIGVIKISQRQLPALRLGNSSALATGKRIYVFGFPVTAEFNWKNFLESTFTQGVISATRDSAGRDFKIFQTDAKVSKGSSGGPLLDERGEVVGIVTFQTGELLTGEGDTFAFAIPIDLANQALVDKLVFNAEGAYGRHFKNGLAWMRGRRCERALEEFELAQNKTYGRFRAGGYLNSYIAECNMLIAQRRSIDTSEAEFREWLKGVDRKVWWSVSGGIILVGGLGTVILLLMKRMKKEEQELHHLESLIEEEKKLRDGKQNNSPEKSPPIESQTKQ